MYVKSVIFTALYSILVFALKFGTYSFLLKSVTLEELLKNGSTFESCCEMEMCFWREVSFIIFYVTFNLFLWCMVVI